MDAPPELCSHDEALRGLVQQYAGRRLPGERELSERLRVSRPRLRAILARLRQEGLVEPRPRSGTYALAGPPGRLRRAAVLIDADLKLGDDPFFLSLVEGLQRSLQAAGARCLIERTDGRGPRPPLEDGAVTLGLAGRAILAGQRPEDPPLVGLLLDADTPARRRASVFGLEDRDAGREAARRLLARGRRDLVFVGSRDIPASRERLAGLEEAAGWGGGRVRFVAGHLNYADGLRLGRDLALPPPDTGGLVAANDWLALGLRAGLTDRHGAAGRDLPLVSFDGLPLTADPALGITSLAVPVAALADDAVAELVRLIRSPGAAGRVVRYPLAWADATP